MIFQRFERAISGRNISGLGLGLYIVKSIADALGGSVKLDSELGKGSTFIIELPLQPPQQKSVEKSDLNLANIPMEQTNIADLGKFNAFQ